MTSLAAPWLSCNFNCHGSKHDIAASEWTASITASRGAEHCPSCAACMRPVMQARSPLQPPQQRLQRAVWRGSNTDSRVALMDETNVLDVMRTRLHMFGRWFPDAIDAHYTGFPQQAFSGNCIGELMPPGGYDRQAARPGGRERARVPTWWLWHLISLCTLVQEPLLV